MEKVRINNVETRAFRITDIIFVFTGERDRSG